MAKQDFPQPPSSVPASSFADCDAAIDRLKAGAASWVETSRETRITLLREAIQGMLDVSQGWVSASASAKGHHPGSPGAGEEHVAGIAPVIRHLRLFADTLKAGGKPKAPAIRQRRDGQWVARVFPASLFDRALFTGFTCDLWIEPGKPPSQGAIYRAMDDGKTSPARVSLVLGAGNQAAIPPLDAMHKLLVEDEVVLLKMNPVNEYLGPFIERAFAAFIQRGFLEVIYGGAEVGAYVCKHPDIHSIHITGSDRTHDAIIWGGDRSEHAQRKREGNPVNTKPITSELGCVTPIVVVPDTWSDADIQFQARHVASMVAHNASFNCNAGKVLVTSRDWPQRDAFLSAVREQLRKMPPRKAYYPGAAARLEGFLQAYPQAEKLGADGPDIVPWTFIPGIGTEDGEYGLCNEAFCGLLTQVDLDGADAASFLAQAVPFCNDRLWGTLSMGMLIHDKTARTHADALDQAIADLRYGGISLNTWPGLIFGLATPSWGAFPGHTLEDIQSGIGAVHNTFLFDHPQKSVLRAPFRIVPKPAWFFDHTNLNAVGHHLAKFEAAPSWFSLPALAIAAFRG